MDGNPIGHKRKKMLFAMFAVSLMLCAPLCITCDAESVADDDPAGIVIDSDTDDLTVKFALGPNASYSKPSGDSPAKLTLSGVDVTFDEPVAVKSTLNLVVSVTDGTVNRIAAGDSDTGASACIWSEKNLTIEGNGILKVAAGDGQSSHALRSGTDCTLAIMGAEIDAVAGDASASSSYGIFGKYVTIGGNAAVNAIGGYAPNGSSYGIAGDNDLTVSGAEITALSGNAKEWSCGIGSHREMRISDSVVYAESFEGGNSYGITNQFDIVVSASDITAIGYGTGICTMAQLTLGNKSTVHATGITECGAYPMVALQINGGSEILAVGHDKGLKTSKIEGDAAWWYYRETEDGTYQDWGTKYHAQNYGMHIGSGERKTECVMTYDVNGTKFQDDVLADTECRILRNHFDPDHAFLGWTSGNAIYLPGEKYVASKNATFAADMDGKDTCSVTFDLNGGTGDVPYTFNVEKGKQITLKNYDAKKGSKGLIGWTDGTAICKPGMEYAVDEDVMFEAVYETHAVTFKTDKGAQPEPQTVAHGAKAAEPESPTAKEYVFLGWYRNGVLWDFDSCTVSDDIQLEARWLLWIEDLVVECDENGRCNVLIPSWSGVKTLTVIHGKMSLFFAADSVEMVKDGTLHVSMNAAGDGEFNISVKLENDEFGGLMKVTLPYDTSKKDPQVYWRSGTGDVKMDSTINDDGTLSFDTEHNSTFMIKYADEPGPGPDPEPKTVMPVVIVAVIIVLLAMFALISFWFILAPKRRWRRGFTDEDTD